MVIRGTADVGCTKANMSARDGPLTELIRGMLWELRQREGGVGYVFKNIYNAHKPMHPDSVTNFFAKFCRKWGIKFSIDEGKLNSYFEMLDFIDALAYSLGRDVDIVTRSDLGD